MPLTDVAIRNAKPAKKTKKMFDGQGLYLEVSPRGGKWWRLKYRFEGKEKRLSLGVYPEVSLKEARRRKDEARDILGQGLDPSTQRKLNHAETRHSPSDDFETVAREWFKRYEPSWAESHAVRIIRRLERDIFPWLGKLPFNEITAPKLLEPIRRIEDRGALETARRALSNCGQVFRYAVATGRVDRDITPDLRGALAPTKGSHFASITDPDKVGELLRILDGYEGSLIVKCALRFAPLVFVRPGELRYAEWKDIDFDAAEWRYFVTKTKSDHIVPLSKQALVILEELKPLTGRSRYLFHCARSRSRPMSDNAMLAAMRRLGIPKEEMTTHGFRAMARTLLDEVLGFRPDIIEHQLAHAVRDPNGRAYNRTSHLDKRKAMMQEWADYLDELKAGAKVIPFDHSA